jgi:peptidoglycan/LPS O-acetylase OafA/YrhL
VAAGPELPYLGAGALALVGGAIKQGHWPSNSLAAIIATVMLVVFASATGDTKIAPVVRAIGLLFFMAALFGVVRASVNKQKTKTKKV